VTGCDIETPRSLAKNVAGEKKERTLFLQLYSCSVSLLQTTPQWSHCGPARISIPQYQLQLTRLHLLQCLLRNLRRARGAVRDTTDRPPAKPALRQSLLTEPKTLPVIDQDLYRCPSPVPEYKHAPGEGIFLKLIAAHTGQSVYAIPKVDGIHSHKYPHLRRQREHLDLCSQKGFFYPAPVH
jgi:hypothetical protein